jgi:hypothetical protein
MGIPVMVQDHMSRILNLYLSGDNNYKTMEELEGLAKDVVSEQSQLLKRLGLREEQFSEAELFFLDLTMERTKVFVPDSDLLSNSENRPQKWVRRFIQKQIKQGKKPFEIVMEYLAFLEDTKNFSKGVTLRLKENTFRILEQLYPPETPTFSIKGMVVSPVQSGKTTQMAALVQAAIETGYKLIIVLGGTNSSLRNQTQIRFEQDVLGRSSENNELIGVGAYADKFRDDIEFVTFTDQEKVQGDSLHKAYDPVKKANVIIIKKNANVLRKLRRWLQKQSFWKDGSCDIPVLVIDDEIDTFSVNNKEIGKEPSAVNYEIRTMLSMFNRHAYVGFTATAYSIIFGIPPKDETDLFPRDFIIYIHPPGNYLGPYQFLRRGSCYPFVERIDEDGDGMLGEDEKWDYEEGIQPSMKKGIRYYLLSGGICRLRGLVNKHHTMLIHVSSKVDPQEKIKLRVQEYLDEIKTIIKDEDFNHPFWDQLNQLWVKDIKVNSPEIYELEKKRLIEEGWSSSRASAHLEEKFCINFSWEEVQEAVVEFIKDMGNPLRNLPEHSPVRKKFVNHMKRQFNLSDLELENLPEILEINAQSPDRLNYELYKGIGLKAIVVGGNILSRGFTVEGLCCSYYTRPSFQYDTNLQAGRWFGYHDRHKDLIKVYLIEDAIELFHAATETLYELEKQFEKMAEFKKTPSQFFFRVQKVKKHRLTSPQRMRYALQSNPNFDGYSSDVAAFTPNDEILKQNYFATECLLKNIISDCDDFQTKTLIHNFKEISFRNVRYEHVMEFLNDYHVFEGSRIKEMDKHFLTQYIENKGEKGEFPGFDVIFVNIQRGVKRTLRFNNISGHNFDIGLAERSQNQWVPARNTIKVSLGRAISNQHQWLGLTDEEIEQIEEESGIAKGSQKVPREELFLKYRRGYGRLFLYAFNPETINDALEGKEGFEGFNEEVIPIGFHIALPSGNQVRSNNKFWYQIGFLKALKSTLEGGAEE